MTGLQDRARQVGMVVRRVESRDVAAIAALERAAFPEPWTAAGLAAELARETSIALVAREEGANEAAGYALFLVAADEAELLRIAVGPRHRRRGLAHRLLTSGLQAIAARGCHVCHLEVASTNRPALILYETVGFAPVGRRLGYYGRLGDALLLSLSVAPDPG